MVSQVDKSNMRQVILDFPTQLETGLKCAQRAIPIIKNPVTKIVIAGMGGSALPGELLKLVAGNGSILSRPAEIHIHRNYGLPYYADDQTLVICISYSGGTEEAISAYDEARVRKLPVAVIAMGGALLEKALRDGVAVAQIPTTHIQPRSAIGYQFAALIKILSNAGIISLQDDALIAAAKSLSPASSERHGKTIAVKLARRTPLFYASQANKALAYILKIKINENAKTMAFYNYFPELNHNEMVGFTQPQNKFSILMLTDRSDNPHIQRRMDLTADIAKKYHIPVLPIDITNERIYNKVFNALLLGDWISYYLAILYKTDPTPVKIVEELKKRLAK
ncbi:MAG: bifunctional phosphoglucose/phosphomannose isomerase [Candidatus Spechtbacteria bacterium]|nr:bifunctional phosphoglucose/phosphomannose isomerase [Candidatus Spechtbacteria bacterium]